MTDRLRDRLVREFGEENVFTDVTSVPPSVDYRRALREQIAGCDVMIVVIGPRWLSAEDDSGPRLGRRGDMVRVEVETGLKSGMPVIPLLVDGARMPDAHQLPESIAELAYRNAAQLRRDPDFHRDVDRLIGSAPFSGSTLIGRLRRPSSWLVWAAIVAVMATAGTGLVMVLTGGDGQGEGEVVPTTESPTAAPTTPPDLSTSLSEGTVELAQQHAERIEAEDGAIVSPMVARSDPSASGGAYVLSPADNDGALRIDFDVPNDGVYVFWGRVSEVYGGSLDPVDTGSFAVALDGAALDVWDFTEGIPDPPLATWRWEPISLRCGGDFETHLCDPWSARLDAGGHSLTLLAREFGSGIDALVVTDDPDYRPPS